MSTTRTSRKAAIAASAAAFLLAGGLWLAPGALAAPTACADLVNLQVKLTAANDALAALSATAPLADREAATQKVTDAELAVRTCEADDVETTTVTPAPTTTKPADDPVAALLVRIAALRCGATFNRDYGAIRDRQFALIADTTAAEQGRITDAITARLRALGFCGGTVTDPTADDGSTPATSGEQVIIVPEGSASTGWA